MSLSSLLAEMALFASDEATDEDLVRLGLLDPDAVQAQPQDQPDGGGHVADGSDTEEDEGEKGEASSGRQDSDDVKAKKHLPGGDEWDVRSVGEIPDVDYAEDEPLFDEENAADANGSKEPEAGHVKLKDGCFVVAEPVGATAYTALFSPHVYPELGQMFVARLVIEKVDAGSYFCVDIGACLADVPADVPKLGHDDPALWYLDTDGYSRAGGDLVARVANRSRKIPEDVDVLLSLAYPQEAKGLGELSIFVPSAMKDPFVVAKDLPPGCAPYIRSQGACVAVHGHLTKLLGASFTKSAAKR
jgi:hypothetical protein